MQATLAVADGQASVSGLMRCSSPWACSCCAPKLAAQRAAILGPQVAAHMRAGGSCWLITLTISHGPTDALDDLLAGNGKGWSRVTSGRAWKKLREEGGVEYIRGYDVTLGENGWHPHIHMLLLLGPEHDDPEDVAGFILTRWMTACMSLGLKVRRAGQDVQRARDEREATSYAVTPAAVYEVGAMAMKRARGKGQGLTPFEVLERAVAERADRERYAGKQGVDVQDLPQGPWETRWREYVSATKGLRQVTTSRGLTLADDDVAEDDQAEPLAELGSATLRHLDRTGRTTDLLDQAERPAANRMEQLRSIERFLTQYVCVQTYTDCDWTILWPPDSPEAERDRTIREERVRRQDAEVAEVVTESEQWFRAMREELKRERGLRAFR